MTFAEAAPARRTTGAETQPAMVGLLARRDEPTPRELLAAKRRGDTDYRADRSRMKYEDFARDRWSLRSREQLYGAWQVTRQNGRWRW